MKPSAYNLDHHLSLLQRVIDRMSYLGEWIKAQAMASTALCGLLVLERPETKPFVQPVIGVLLGICMYRNILALASERRLRQVYNELAMGTRDANWYTIGSYIRDLKLIEAARSGSILPFYLALHAFMIVVTLYT